MNSHQIPSSANKMIPYCQKQAEKARKQEGLSANQVVAEDIRRWLRRIITNVERRHEVTFEPLADNEIIPWILAFYRFQEPVHTELALILLQIGLFVHFGMIERETGLRIAASVERRCVATME